jgi:hypothetical protein
VLRLLFVLGTIGLAACQSARAPACPGQEPSETVVPPNWSMNRPGTVVATLEGARGRRIDQAQIELERVGANEGSNVAGSNDRGIVRITGLEQGEYAVEITAPSHLAWRGRVTVDATPGDTTRLRLQESRLCVP